MGILFSLFRVFWVALFFYILTACSNPSISRNHSGLTSQEFQAQILSSELLVARGQYPKALKNYQRVLNLSPRAELFLEVATLVENLRRDTKQGFTPTLKYEDSLSQKWLSYSPFSKEALDYRAGVLVRQGDTKAALKMLLKRDELFLSKNLQSVSSKPLDYEVLLQGFWHQKNLLEQASKVFETKKQEHEPSWLSKNRALFYEKSSLLWVRSHAFETPKKAYFVLKRTKKNLERLHLFSNALMPYFFLERERVWMLLGDDSDIQKERNDWLDSQYESEENLKTMEPELFYLQALNATTFPQHYTKKEEAVSKAQEAILQLFKRSDGLSLSLYRKMVFLGSELALEDVFSPLLGYQGTQLDFIKLQLELQDRLDSFDEMEERLQTLFKLYPKEGSLWAFHAINMGNEKLAIQFINPNLKPNTLKQSLLFWNVRLKSWLRGSENLAQKQKDFLASFHKIAFFVNTQAISSQPLNLENAPDSKLFLETLHLAFRLFDAESLLGIELSSAKKLCKQEEIFLDGCAQLWLDLGDLKRAKRAIEVDFYKFGATPRWLKLKGNYFLLKGYSKKAILALQWGWSLDGDDDEFLLLLAKSYLQNHERMKASALISRVSSRHLVDGELSGYSQRTQLLAPLLRGE